MEVIWAHHGVVCPRVMFTLIVNQILLAGLPFKRIHILCFFSSPKIPHFHCLQELLFDGIIGNINGCCIVTMDGVWGCGLPRFLRVSQKIIPS